MVCLHACTNLKGNQPQFNLDLRKTWIISAKLLDLTKFAKMLILMKKIRVIFGQNNTHYKNNIWNSQSMTLILI